MKSPFLISGMINKKKNHKKYRKQLESAESNNLIIDVDYNWVCVNAILFSSVGFFHGDIKDLNPYWELLLTPFQLFLAPINGLMPFLFQIFFFFHKTIWLNKLHNRIIVQPFSHPQHNKIMILV